jgi:hypothetical protein
MWFNRLLFTALGLFLANAAPLQGPLTDQQVARAIARADKLTDPYVCVGRSVAAEFSVCIQGPEQRIGLAAALAKQARRRFRPADASADLRAQTWTIVVRPNQPALVDGRPVHTPPAEDLRLQLRGHPETAVRPLNAARIPVAWDNAVGVTLKGQGLMATLDASTLPAGDLDMVVIAEGRTERLYVLSESARAQIR